MSQTTFPYGHSLLPVIFKKDSRSTVSKTLELFLTSFTLLTVPLLPSVLNNIIFADDNIETYGYLNLSNTLNIIDLSHNHIWTAAIITWFFYFILVVMDVFGVRWPQSWNTTNNKCYYAMFSEPQRYGQFIGHLGNTLSNFMYSFTGICVLISCYYYQSLFIIPDALFGIMCIVLSILSVIWHASNAPKSQYFDLWVMDNCIIYLQIRYIGVGLHKLSSIYLSENVGIIVTFLLYLFFIVKNGKRQLKHLSEQTFDNCCPFSGRSRIQEHTANIRLIATFLFMPIIFFIGPAITLACIGSLGHLSSLTIAILSLSIGWFIRMFDRWVLDGFYPINAVKDNVILSAFLSPTAIFHVLTGVTLFTGYVHVRSLP